MRSETRRWTPANIVSAARIGAFPLIVVLVYAQSWTGEDATIRGLEFAAGLVLAVAFVTDMLDGYLARSRNEVTVLGKFLDPLSDKVLVVTALLLLVMQHRAPAWLAILIVLREMAITGLRTIASAEGLIIQASVWGKLKTVLQAIALCALLFHETYDFLWLFPLPMHLFGTVMLYAALAVTLWSGWEYLRAFHAAEMPVAAPAAGENGGETRAR
ncbi:CDP-diacylglycerol--glycerol-3-phosphate 3-phosphatidyltransferase [bacterium]|nr:CDP-diacylglycerol--glycerol-3-phosphate 3-phosphatidyltransferase [bacterium]